MEKIRVAIVGAGNIAQSAHLPAYQKRNDLEVVAIADWNLERAQDAAKKFGIPKAFQNIDDMLANVDCDYVDICVWNRSHADCAIKAATGTCVMPTDGIFAVVVEEGTIRPGDGISIEEEQR